MKTQLARRLLAAGLFVLACGTAATVSAHAFPDNSSPHVGASVSPAPKQVKIWFNADIEPLFSTLIVKSSNGNQVSIGKGAIPSGQTAQLVTRLKPLSPGLYAVYWSVIARDGHHTEGRWYFTVK